MLTTKTHIELRSKKASIVAYFFFMVGILLLTGLVAQSLDYLNVDNIEFSENAEKESETEKKENKKESESDKYSSELMQYALFNLQKLKGSDGYFHKWQNPSANIITPPPEFV